MMMVVVVVLTMMMIIIIIITSVIEVAMAQCVDLRRQHLVSCELGFDSDWM